MTVPKCVGRSLTRTQMASAVWIARRFVDWVPPYDSG